MTKQLVNSKNVYAEQHPFYSIEYSPWPIWISVSLLGFLLFFTFRFMHNEWYYKQDFSNIYLTSPLLFKVLKTVLVLFYSCPFIYLIHGKLPEATTVAELVDKVWNLYWSWLEKAVESLTSFFYKCQFSIVLWLLMLFFAIYGWSKDLIIEAVYKGYHTLAVQKAIKQGFLFFILTEVMFFFGFFWGYLHYSLNPSIFIGGIWPPKGITPINPFSLPLLNTVILLYSGLTITWAHRAIIARNVTQSMLALIATIFLGLFFVALQSIEYITLELTINTSVYGSIFFLMTGFHGAHVIIGLFLIIVSTVRLLCAHFTAEHHVGLETAIWYWHFVDVVWLFLYIIVYWWTA